VSLCCVCVFSVSVRMIHTVVIEFMGTVPLEAALSLLHVLQSPVNSVTGVRTSEVVL
jgi:hypothetical protein